MSLLKQRGRSVAMTTLAVLLSNLFTACASSPPVQFFALEAAANSDPTKLVSSSIVQVTRVHVPPSLDRQQIVRESGPYTVEISDRHRWSAPLDEIIRRVLTEYLLQLLPAGNIVLPKEPAPPGTKKLVVDILKFEADPSGTVQFAELVAFALALRGTTSQPLRPTLRALGLKKLCRSSGSHEPHP